MATGNLKYYLGVGALVDRPTTPDLYPDVLGLYLDDDTGTLYGWNGTSWDTVGSGTVDARFIAASFAPVVNTASLMVFRHKFAINVDFPASLTGSQFGSTAAATASATYTIRKNGVSVGTLVWGAGATVPTVTFASAQSFVVGDVLDVVGPVSPDATLAGVTLSFLGAKV